MNIILSGLPASGKSTTGAILAKKLGWNFFDTDLLIEARGDSRRTLYLEKGEAHFRAVEKEVIRSLATTKNSVIATGGGTFCDEENSLLLSNLGVIVYLQASIDTLWNRLVLRGLPAYLVTAADPKREFYELAEKRIPFYERAAKFLVTTDALCPETIAMEVVKIYGK